MHSTYIYWSKLINLILQTYLSDFTICIIWHDDYDFQLQSADTAAGKRYYAILNIDKANFGDTFEHNVVNFASKAEQLRNNELDFDDLMLKLAVSIEKTHCEGFIVFGTDISIFVKAFERTRMYSIWRSMRSRFIFAYNLDDLKHIDFQAKIFQDQPNILLLENVYQNGTYFAMKTNKYVGPRAERQEPIYVLDYFNAIDGRFAYNRSLFPDKTKDLQGRELVIATFDYRPYAVLKYNITPPNAVDVGFERVGTAPVYIDGTETRVIMSFCEQYNCTVQIDTSDADDWGTIYPNMSGDGAMGMIINHKAEICIGAMYSWYEDYIYLDMSMYLVRSGITCLVPKPRRMASWLLPLQPFKATLWAAVLLCMLIEIVGLVVTYKSEMILFAEHENGWWSGIKFAAITTFKLFISQSGNSYVSSMTVRVLLFACFLNDIIITSIYGGGLASILTIPSLDEASDTLARLHKHKLKWAANSAAWVTAIRASDDPLIVDILENFYIYTDEELYEMSLSEYMGFTLERLPFGHFAIGDFLTSETIERMKIMQDDIYFQYTVAFVPRLWPLLERFNDLIYSWHSSGFDKFWEYRVVADNLNVQLQQQVESTMLTNLDDIGPVKLGMSNFVGMLLIWVIGIFVSILIFFGELLFPKHRQTN